MGRRRLFISEATEAHVLAEGVADRRGQWLVRAGANLTDALIRRLQQLGVKTVIVTDPEAAGIETREGLSPVAYTRLAAFLTEMASFVEKKKEMPAEASAAVTEWGQTIRDELGDSSFSFLLYAAEREDPLDRWVTQAINRALLSATMLLGLNGFEQAEWMASAALIQDVGVWCLEPEDRLALLFGEVEDTDRLQRRIAETQRLARQLASISPFVRAVVAQYGERIDGSGFPSGKQGDAIHPLARMSALVDVYLTYIGQGDDPLLPHEAVEALMAGVGFEYDPTAFKAFQNSVQPYPVGTEVALNTGEKGIVSRIRGRFALRPIVRILRDAAVPPSRSEGLQEIDLAQETTRLIVQVLN